MTKILTPYIRTGEFAAFARYSIEADRDITTRWFFVYQEDMGNGEALWYHSFSIGKVTFNSCEDAKKDLDCHLAKNGYEFLTEEEYSNLKILM